MYPSAEEGEWRRKSMGEERQLRVVELINHDTKPDDVFKEKENQVIIEYSILTKMTL